jgi:hypothetical protein
MATDTQRVTHTIPLEVQSPQHAGLVFLRAVINARRHLPFALVHYVISGVERGKALRLDLGKCRFIDVEDAEPNNPEFAKAAFLLAPIIAQRVNMEALKWFTSSGAEGWF